MAHAAALRSPHAHARIRSIDKSAAEALPGVVAVITGEEAANETGPLPCFANPPVEQRAIALGKVRHVGEPVALVVADTRYIAEDAIALIKVDLRAIAGRLRHDGGDQFARRGGAPSRARPGQCRRAPQLCLRPGRGGVRPRRPRIKRRLRWSRSGGQPIETAGAVASFRRRLGQVHDLRQRLDVQLRRLHHRRRAQGPEPSGQHRAGRRRRQLRQQAFSAQGIGPRRVRPRASPAARSSISRTASTTSPRATITAPTASTTSSWRSTPIIG